MAFNVHRIADEMHANLTPQDGTNSQSSTSGSSLMGKRSSRPALPQSQAQQARLKRRQRSARKLNKSGGVLGERHRMSRGQSGSSATKESPSLGAIDVAHLHGEFDQIDFESHTRHLSKNLHAEADIAHMEITVDTLDGHLESLGVGLGIIDDTHGMGVDDDHGLDLGALGLDGLGMSLFDDPGLLESISKPSTPEPDSTTKKDGEKTNAKQVSFGGVPVPDLAPKPDPSSSSSSVPVPVPVPTPSDAPAPAPVPVPVPAATGAPPPPMASFASASSSGSDGESGGGSAPMPSLKKRKTIKITLSSKITKEVELHTTENEENPLTEEQMRLRQEQLVSKFSGLASMDTSRLTAQNIDAYKKELNDKKLVSTFDGLKSIDKLTKNELESHKNEILKRNLVSESDYLAIMEKAPEKSESSSIQLSAEEKERIDSVKKSFESGSGGTAMLFMNESVIDEYIRPKGHDLEADIRHDKEGHLKESAQQKEKLANAAVVSKFSGLKSTTKLIASVDADEQKSIEQARKVRNFKGLKSTRKIDRVEVKSELKGSALVSDAAYLKNLQKSDDDGKRQKKKPDLSKSVSKATLAAKNMFQNMDRQQQSARNLQPSIAAKMNQGKRKSKKRLVGVDT